MHAPNVPELLKAKAGKENEMSTTKKTEECYHKESLTYKDDEMTRPICLICGEHIGGYEYRGKAVCHECIRYINENF